MHGDVCAAGLPYVLIYLPHRSAEISANGGRQRCAAGERLADYKEQVRSATQFRRVRNQLLREKRTVMREQNKAERQQQLRAQRAPKVRRACVCE
jgi:hypothetical protein